MPRSKWNAEMSLTDSSTEVLSRPQTPEQHAGALRVFNRKYAKCIIPLGIYCHLAVEYPVSDHT